LAKQFATSHNNLVLSPKPRSPTQISRSSRGQYAISPGPYQGLANPASPLEIFEELEKQSVKDGYLVNNAGSTTTDFSRNSTCNPNRNNPGQHPIPHASHETLPTRMIRTIRWNTNVASTAPSNWTVDGRVFSIEGVRALSTEALANELHWNRHSNRSMPRTDKTSSRRGHEGKCSTVQTWSNGRRKKNCRETGMRLMKGKRVVIPGLATGCSPQQ